VFFYNIQHEIAREIWLLNV